MITAIADQIALISDHLPCAFFGHSMGAMLCFEVALEIGRRKNMKSPRRLFLSGRNPPHSLAVLPPIAHLTDRDFLAAIGERYGNLPAALLANREMMSLLATVLRADVKLVESYRWSNFTLTDVPLTIMGGHLDRSTSPERLSEWQRYTNALSSIHLFPGGHFFLQDHFDKVLKVVRRDCENAAV